MANRFANADLTYDCNCPSKNTVWVESTFFMKGHYTCRSPKCTAIRGAINTKLVENEMEEWKSRANHLTEIVEEQKNTIETQKEKISEAETKIDDLTKQIAEKDRKICELQQTIQTERENMAKERENMAKSLVTIFTSGPVTVNSQTSSGLTKTTGKKTNRKITPKIDRITKAPPLPNNYMVGDVYVSGIVNSFGHEGF